MSDNPFKQQEGDFTDVPDDGTFTVITPRKHREFPELHRDSKVPFGKYKGVSMMELVVTDPNYLMWLVNDTTCKVAEDVVLAAKESIEERHRDDVNRAFNDRINWECRDLHNDIQF